MAAVTASPNLALRLHSSVAAVCPITGITIGNPGDPATVSFIPDPSATAAQITSAQNTIDSFDWSDTGQSAWDLQQTRGTAVNNLGVTVDVYMLLRALMLVLLDEVNLIRSLLVPAQTARTAAQVRTAITNKINAGNADS